MHKKFIKKIINRFVFQSLVKKRKKIAIFWDPKHVKKMTRFWTPFLTPKNRPPDPKLLGPPPIVKKKLSSWKKFLARHWIKVSQKFPFDMNGFYYYLVVLIYIGSLGSRFFAIFWRRWGIKKLRFGGVGMSKINFWPPPTPKIEL